MRKRRLALIDSTFRIGLPSNEVDLWTHPHGNRVNCLCDADYSGDDPLIQFPEGWHVICGNGLDRPEARTWRYHQDCLQFEPYRVKVGKSSTDIDFPLDPQSEDSLLVRMMNGGDSPYSARMDKRFAQVNWEQGIELVYVWWFMYDYSMQVPLYANFEGRGALAFNQGSDPNKTQGTVKEFFSVEITDTEFRARWWHNPSLAGKMTGRQGARILYPFAERTWYKLRVHYLAIEPQYTWDIDALVTDTEGNRLVKFQVPPEFRVNSGVYLDTIYFGDERSRDNAGGKWFFTAPRVERLYRAQVTE